MSRLLSHRVRRAMLPLAMGYAALVFVRVLLLLTGAMPAEPAATVSIVGAVVTAALLTWLGWMLRRTA